MNSTFKSELLKNDNYYETIFNNSSTAMCIIEKNSIISLVNEYFIDFTGVSKKDTEGQKKWTDFVIREDRAKVRVEFLKNLRKNPKPSYKYEFRAISSSKEIKTVLMSIKLIPGTSSSIASLLDITGRSTAEERNKHINKILHSIRNVNIFISKENNKDKLLQGICEILYKTMEYPSLWILKYNNSNKLIKEYHSGEVLGFPEMIMDLKKGRVTKCVINAQKNKNNVISIKDVSTQCSGCPLLGKNRDFRELAKCFEIDNDHYGILSLSVPTKFVENKEEHAIIEAIARDIETALKAIENKKKKEKTDLELKESKNYIQAIYNSIQAGVVLIDEETHKIVDINNAASKIIGQEASKIIGKICHNYICPAEEGKCPISNLNQKVDNSEKILLTKEGIQIPIIKNVNQIYLKGKKYLLESFVDITELKYTENKLRYAKEKAEESDNLETKFFQILSHELRTPLNAIIGFSNLLLDPLPEEEVQEYVQSINNSGTQLLEIIQDMLDLTLMEEDNFKFRKNEFKIMSLFENIPSEIEVIQKKLNKENLDVKFIPSIKDPDIKIYSNPKKIKEIFIKLLCNSIKFTQKGSIEYGYNVYKNEILFFVKDTGIGIPEEKQRIIFEKFRQADDSLTREFGGIGLGLTIVKRIINLLGGKIWVDSKSGTGSTFYFSIQGNIKRNNSYEIPLKIDFSNKTILIAEDIESNFELIKSMLVLSKINIIKARNGQEAVDICTKDSQVDIVIMDLKMPVMDGFEATKKIKDLFPGLIVIVVSAYSSIEIIKKAYEAGCDKFIKKPINKKELLSTLHNNLIK